MDVSFTTLLSEIESEIHVRWSVYMKSNTFKKNLLTNSKLETLDTSNFRNALQNTTMLKKILTLQNTAMLKTLKKPLITLE